MSQPAGRTPFFKRWLPRGLFGRTLMIIVLPVLLTQAVASFVFFDRHWRTVTERMASGVAGEVTLILGLLETEPADTLLPRLQAVAARAEINVRLYPHAVLPNKGPPFFDPVQDVLREALAKRLALPFVVDLQSSLEQVYVLVATPQGLLAVSVPERRLYTPTTVIFILWMTGSALVLSFIAILFMRNQVRPIRRLAVAAEAFGKGQDADGFKPEGAREVRQASAALLGMRDRLRRSIAQRTTMLSGVSHDLRTPLTRMKLQLALLPESAEISDLKADVSEMETMIEAYLAFARGEEAEPAQPTDVEMLLVELVAQARRSGGHKGEYGGTEVQMAMSDSLFLTVRPLAVKRAVSNLLSNALRHGRVVQVAARRAGRQCEIIIDDDGPGIPAEQREEAFRPFVRLDPARSPAGGGVGLGLTIARDIARAHGGDVMLSESPLGGLRAILSLPA